MTDEDPSSTTHQHGAAHQHGKSHHWMHLLMCAPMLAVVGFLVATGAAGGGAIGYALLCMAMMGAMMLFMNQGSAGGHKH